ncbi:hypothetical protein E2C01_083625 [Portunus trituberculatus]|uniref:Uncharacterized protein n=1 Tax=Portunus trituberculatus TaxID=210409 RepID=A0A5B7J449_PORTR|nr:hypothetical protein [Portunus trituberculatus]
MGEAVTLWAWLGEGAAPTCGKPNPAREHSPEKETRQGEGERCQSAPHSALAPPSGARCCPARVAGRGTEQGAGLAAIRMQATLPALIDMTVLSPTIMRDPRYAN